MTFEPNVIVTDQQTARLLGRGRDLQAQAVRQALGGLGRALLAALAGPAVPRPPRPLAGHRRILRLARQPLWY